MGIEVPYHTCAAFDVQVFQYLKITNKQKTYLCWQVLSTDEWTHELLTQHTTQSEPLSTKGNGDRVPTVGLFVVANCCVNNFIAQNW